MQNKCSRDIKIKTNTVIAIHIGPLRAPPIFIAPESAKKPTLAPGAAKNPMTEFPKVPIAKKGTKPVGPNLKLPKNLSRLRLQAVGAAKLDQSVAHTRSKCPDARVVVVSLCWRIQCASADQLLIMTEYGNTAYDIRGQQTVLGYSEFVGLSCAKGVGETIADLLTESESVHVIVVDGTPKSRVFARLAASFGSVYLALKAKRVIKTALPEGTLFADAVAKARACATPQGLGDSMVAYYDAALADTQEPVHAPKKTPVPKIGNPNS